MQHTFIHKVIMMAFFGFCAACVLYMYRHFVAQALWESGPGWKESTYIEKPKKR